VRAGASTLGLFSRSRSHTHSILPDAVDSVIVIGSVLELGSTTTYTDFG